jgi:hypothetical protein
MKINATATLLKSLLGQLNINELEILFADHNVSIKHIKYEFDNLVLGLNGSKDNLRLAVRALHHKLHSLDASDGDAVRKHLADMENSYAYRKYYEHLADEYMKYCVLHDVLPHPEVIEDFVY